MIFRMVRAGIEETQRVDGVRALTWEHNQRKEKQQRRGDSQRAINIREFSK